MKRFLSTERLLIEDVTECAEKLKEASKGLSIGAFIKMIRTQLGMSQKVLAKQACITQSTVCRIEKSEKDVNVSTLNKILEVLSCDLVVLPMMRESIDSIWRKQARKQAEKHIRHLKGTMNLEEQQPDSRLLEQLLKQEEARLLQGPGLELWE